MKIEFQDSSLTRVCRFCFKVFNVGFPALVLICPLKRPTYWSRIRQADGDRARSHRIRQNDGNRARSHRRIGDHVLETVLDLLRHVEVDMLHPLRHADVDVHVDVHGGAVGWWV